MRTRSHRAPNRAGFLLIELLVVAWPRTCAIFFSDAAPLSPAVTAGTVNCD